MRETRLLLSVAGLLALAGCATPQRPPPGPVVSPTGIVYEPGSPPVSTQYSQTAQIYMRSGSYERALEHLLEGLRKEPGNPVHHYLAGSAYAHLGEYDQANRMFTQAERIYPAYELDIEPEREAAWAEAFNAGAESFAAGDTEGAMRAWEGAAMIFALRPEAHRNLAGLLLEEGRYDEAAEVYRRTIAGLDQLPASRVLHAAELHEREQIKLRTEESLAELLLFRGGFGAAERIFRRQLERDPESTRLRGNLASALTGQGRHDEAADLYADLLDEESIEAVQLFNLGVALFRASDYVRAAEAFERLTELQPNSRDVWFNYTNSLFAAESWQALAQAGERLIQLDPLNESAWLITARAHLEAGDERGAAEKLDWIETVPVYVEGLTMRPSPQGTAIHGRLRGNLAAPGTPVRLRFTFYDEGTVVGEALVTLTVPAVGERVSFDLALGAPAAGYRYELEP
ncbi:MAG: tetratricopeptide repeat protein [Dehalococcoidia bacterium]